MPTKNTIIKLKRSEQPGVVPATTELLYGEPAINAVDGKLFIKKGLVGLPMSEEIIEVGKDRTFFAKVDSIFIPNTSNYKRHHLSLTGTTIDITFPEKYEVGDKGKFLCTPTVLGVQSLTFGPGYRFANSLVPEINLGVDITTVLAYEVISNDVIVVDIEAEYYTGQAQNFELEITQDTQPEVRAYTSTGTGIIPEYTLVSPGIWKVTSFAAVANFTVVGGPGGPTEVRVIKANDLLDMKNAFYSGSRGELNTDLKTIIFESTFVPQAVQTFNDTFTRCPSLVYLDLTAFIPFFTGCTSFQNMFNGCSSLTCLSTINTTNITIPYAPGSPTNGMFFGTTSLQNPSVPDQDQISLNYPGATQGMDWVHPTRIPCPDIAFKATINSTSQPIMTYTLNPISEISQTTTVLGTNIGTDLWEIVVYGAVDQPQFGGNASDADITAITFNIGRGITSLFRLFNASGVNTLTSLTDIIFEPAFNTSLVTTFERAFFNLDALTTLQMGPFVTSAAISTYEMFSGLTSIASIDVSSFDMSSVATARGMFFGCSSLASLDLSTWNTQSLTNIISIFAGCSSLTSIDISTINISSVIHLYGVFTGCSSLLTLDLSSWNTSGVIDFSYLFDSCTSLTCISHINTTAAGATKLNMFNNTPAMVNPTAAEITDIISASGLIYFNTNICGTHYPTV